MMKKMSKVVLTGLAVLSILLMTAACRTNRKKVEPTTTPVVETVPPVVDPPPPPADTSVQPPADFVQDTPVEETFPTDLDELNRYVHDRGYIQDAYFNYDEATLDGDAQDALTSSANWLKGREGTGYNVLIEGHCDERGTEQYNLALGDRRANTARDYLVTLGVESGRIRTVSYGEERPFDNGHNESAWRQNRRAHIVLVR